MVFLCLRKKKVRMLMVNVLAMRFSVLSSYCTFNDITWGLVGLVSLFSLYMCNHEVTELYDRFAPNFIFVYLGFSISKTRILEEDTICPLSCIWIYRCLLLASVAAIDTGETVWRPSHSESATNLANLVLLAMDGCGIIGIWAHHLLMIGWTLLLFCLRTLKAACFWCRKDHLWSTSSN